MDELASGRSPRCLEVEKSVLRNEKTTQRHWDVEGNEKPLH